MPDARICSAISRHWPGWFSHGECARCREMESSPTRFTAASMLSSGRAFNETVATPRLNRGLAATNVFASAADAPDSISGRAAPTARVLSATRRFIMDWGNDAGFNRGKRWLGPNVYRGAGALYVKSLKLCPVLPTP